MTDVNQLFNGSYLLPVVTSIPLSHRAVGATLQRLHRGTRSEVVAAFAMSALRSLSAFRPEPDLTVR